LQERGRFEVEEAVHALLQACEAIAEAHASGVVHRDLKPANLFMTTSVDGSPSIKVLDFGVSKILTDLGPSDDVLGTTAPSSDSAIALAPPSSSGARLGLADTSHAAETHGTKTHAVVGSPRYMAPEQVRSARDVDARADVWSLGVILYELVSGERPFDAETLDRLKQSILEEKPRPLDAPVPPEVRGAIDRCLAKEPDARYPNVLALAEDLVPFGGEGARASVERIGRILAGGKRPPSTPTRVPTRPEPAGEAGATTDQGVMREGDKRPSAPAARRILFWAAAAAVFAGVALVGRPWSAREERVQASPSSTQAPSAPVAATTTTIAVPEPPAPPVPLSTPSAASPAAPSAAPLAPPARPRPSARPAVAPSVDPLGIDGGALFNDPH
jgi:serine/threonine-protein kinase